MPRARKPEIFAVPWKSSRKKCCLLLVPVSSHNPFQVSIGPVTLAFRRACSQTCRCPPEGGRYRNQNPALVQDLLPAGLVSESPRKSDRLKSVLLLRGIRQRRLSRAVQNVRMNQSDLRGRNIPGKRRHSEFPPRATQHDFLKHFVCWLRGIAQVRHRSSADRLPAVAPCAGIRKKLAAFFNFGLGSSELERRHRNRPIHMLVRRNRRRASQCKHQKFRGTNVPFAGRPIAEDLRPAPPAFDRNILDAVHREGHGWRRDSDSRV